MECDRGEVIGRALIHYRPIETASSTCRCYDSMIAGGDWTPGGQIVPMTSRWQYLEMWNESLS